MIELLLFIILIVIFILLWLIGIFVVNDFLLPTKDLRQYKHILIIFPHADDEVLHTAGLIRIASQQKIRTTLAVLTKGERGTSDAHLDNTLKAIRTKEAQVAAKIYGVTKLIQEDFGDDRLTSKKKELNLYIDTMIKQETPDLIITYDLAGEYGHPDHIVVSEIVTELVKKKHTEVALWYATFPKLIYNMGQFPTQMAEDPNFMKRRAPATIKVFIGLKVIQKIQATYLYKSQYQSFKSAVPYNLPLGLVFSLFIAEYFHPVN